MLYLVWQWLTVMPETTIEAGTEVKVEELLRLPALGKVSLENTGGKVDTRIPGTYRLRVRVGFFTYGCSLIVKDTIAPAVQPASVVIARGETAQPEDFVEGIIDATKTSVEFGIQPDFEHYGETENVLISVKDAGGNETMATATLLIVPFHYTIKKEIGSGLPQASEFIQIDAPDPGAAIETDLSTVNDRVPGVYDLTLVFRGNPYPARCEYVDTTPPEFLNAEAFSVIAGETISYKSMVKVEDNSGMYSLTVDADAVNPLELGVYPVYYTAMDSSGNASGVVLNISVEEETAAESVLRGRTETILDQILTPNMSKREQAQAIFDYITGHMKYQSYSEKNGEVLAALQGLGQGQGDCYVYFSMAKALLTRAGIQNMDIKKREGSPEMHYWNLIDIGDGHGWYHFDTTPHADHPTIFLWDNARLMAYSEGHRGSHDYDPTLYPAIP